MKWNPGLWFGLFAIIYIIDSIRYQMIWCVIIANKAVNQWFNSALFPSIRYSGCPLSLYCTVYNPELISYPCINRYPPPLPLSSPQGDLRLPPANQNIRIPPAVLLILNPFLLLILILLLNKLLPNSTSFCKVWKLPVVCHTCLAFKGAPQANTARPQNSWHSRHLLNLMKARQCSPLYPILLWSCL